MKTQVLAFSNVDNNAMQIKKLLAPRLKRYDAKPCQTRPHHLVEK